MAPSRSKKQSNAAKKKDDENNKLIAEMKARIDAVEEETRQKTAELEAQLNEKNVFIQQQKDEFAARLAEKQSTLASNIVSDGAQANDSVGSNVSTGEDSTSAAAVTASIDTVNQVGTSVQNELLGTSDGLSFSSDSPEDTNASGGSSRVTGNGDGNGSVHDGDDSNFEEPMDEESSENDLVGNDYYSVNMASIHGAAICRKSGTLDFDRFDFEVDKWLIQNTPHSVLSMIKSTRLNKRNEPIGGVKRDFHTKFDKFANEIFSRLGDIYPYLVPNEVALPLCSRFFQLYDKQKELNSYFSQYKDSFPGALFTTPTKSLPVPVNCSVLLFRKLDNLFNMRSTKIKLANVWPFKVVKDRSEDKYDPIPLKKVETKFEYNIWKPKVEQRMDGKRKANQKVLTGRAKRRMEAAKVKTAEAEAAKLKAAEVEAAMLESQRSEVVQLQSVDQSIDK